MRVRSYRSPLAALLVVLGSVVVISCKSVPPAPENVNPQAPKFESSAKPAEKVDEATGFKEASPTPESLSENSTSSEAEKANAQGLLKPIHFDFDKADIRPDAQQTMTADAGRIREHGSLKVRIEGHCDERGTVEYNLALGDRRARAARDYLVSAGIPAQRLRTISFGKERPLDPGHTESAWSVNRRAEFIFVAE
jgi:peptidoglycan-associated lipoprotein